MTPLRDKPPSLFRRFPRWAVLAWVVLLAGVLGRVAVAPLRSGSVVPIYLKAGERWRAGENPYASAPPLDVFRNPPGVAAFFAPWSLLPDRAAALLWRLLGVAVYLTGLRAWLRLLPADAAGDRQLGWFAFLAALLVVPSFNNGQVNVLLGGCVLHAAAAVAGGRLWPAAGWVAVATFFKIYPLAFGLLLCVVRPRFALRLVPAVAAAVALPFALQRPEYVADVHRWFVELIELDARLRHVVTRWPWDWTIVPLAWLDVRVSGPVVKLVSAAAGIVFAAALWAVNRRRPDAALVTAMTLGCGWMTLFGPATENATYTLLAPIAAAVALDRPWHRRPLALIAVGLFALPILRGLFPSSEVLPLRTAQPLGVVLLLISTAVELRRKVVPFSKARTGTLPAPHISEFYANS